MDMVIHHCGNLDVPEIIALNILHEPLEVRVNPIAVRIKPGGQFQLCFQVCFDIQQLILASFYDVTAAGRGVPLTVPVAFQSKGRASLQQSFLGALTAADNLVKPRDLIVIETTFASPAKLQVLRHELHIQLQIYGCFSGRQLHGTNVLSPWDFIDLRNVLLQSVT